MKNNILYERSITIPNLHGHFRRPRIDRLLGKFLDCHLIAVIAGAGWGKTQAVSAFLNNIKARVIWFHLSELDNYTSRFWEEFIYIMEFQSKETAGRLKLLGFPETLAKYDKFLHILAKEVYAGEQVVIVFDDFHLIYDESVLKFVQKLIIAKLENFCIIINTREKISFNLFGMLNNGLAGEITAEDLCFTPDETDAYLKQQGVSLPEWKIKRVHKYTEGWPLALYLVGLSIKKGAIVSNDPIAGAIPLIFEMIERDMFSGYSPQIQNFLIRVSLLNSFPEGLIKTLVGDNLESTMEFLSKNMLINYNPYTCNYNFHHLFLEFLTGKQKYLTEDEITDTYVKSAKWCAANDLKIEALTYFDKCGCYEEILNIMYNFGVAIFSKKIAEFYISLIDKLPDEFMKNNPMLHIYRAGLLYNNAEVQPAIDELLETQKELENLPCSEINRTVLGEIFCMLGLISLGMGNYDFVDLFTKASEYLPNGGMIDNTGKAINTRYAIMLSCPAHGELEKMESAMFYAMPYASKTMHGYGQGLDYLASAEAAYFTGDMKKALKNAYEAIYRSREKQVIDVASSGYFLLMRIEAATGNYKGIISNMEQMKTYVEGFEDKWNFNGIPDVAEGWLNLLLGRAEKVPGWLVDDTLGVNVLAPYSIGMERSIKARYLLRDGKYYELLAWINQTEKPLRRYNIWLILLDILICKSIACHHIHDEDQTVAALREAYEIAHENNLTMQFVELGNDICTVINKVKRNEQSGIPDSWLDEIFTKAATYEKHLRNIKTQHRQSAEPVSKPRFMLTKREKELLGYLCQGLTNKDIADTCFITISAVKKTINNIYIKLSATNRADAVRIAMQMELYR